MILVSHVFWNVFLKILGIGYNGTIRIYLSTSFLTSSQASTVKNSGFDNRFLVIFTRLNNVLPQWSFNDLKTETSNGYNTWVVRAGSLMIATFFSFAKHIVPYRK